MARAYFHILGEWFLESTGNRDGANQIGLQIGELRHPFFRTAKSMQGMLSCFSSINLFIILYPGLPINRGSVLVDDSIGQFSSLPNFFRGNEIRDQPFHLTRGRPVSNSDDLDRVRVNQPGEDAEVAVTQGGYFGGCGGLGEEFWIDHSRVQHAPLHVNDGHLAPMLETGINAQDGHVATGGR